MSNEERSAYVYKNYMIVVKKGYFFEEKHFDSPTLSNRAKEYCGLILLEENGAVRLKNFLLTTLGKQISGEGHGRYNIF